MATLSEAQSVKSLNTGPGRRRFVFKSFNQRIEDVDINVFRSLEPVKADPSEDSSFFRETLVEWRELNTAEDFISFYEEMTPLVQSLWQILHHKELIVMKLLSRLHMKGRLSLEPILRLIAALSRDLLDAFVPFLQNVADSILHLLKSGADKDPDIIEQIFTSWSSMIMYLQKYLVKDVVHVLRVTVELRYYPKDYIQELIAESVSFLLRNASRENLEEGVREVMTEVANKPKEETKSGPSALLWYTMRGTSSKLHSKAEKVLRSLLDESILGIGENFGQGNHIVEVVIEAFQRLCEELQPGELILMWKYLYNEITKAMSSGHLLHLCHLLSVLIPTIQPNFFRKLSDHQLIIKLVESLMQKFVLPPRLLEEEEISSEVINMTLQLMLCVLDGLHLVDNVSGLNVVCLQCKTVFNLRNLRLLPFIKELLLKDLVVVNCFKQEILSTLNDFIETREEDVISLLLTFGEKVRDNNRSFGFLNSANKEAVLKLSSYFESNMRNWITATSQIATGKPSPIQLQETRLALLWGIISCCSHMKDMHFNPQLLLDLAGALNQLLLTGSGSEYIAGFQIFTWQSLIGCSLRSYNNLISGEQSRTEIVGQFLQLATRHRSSSHIVSAVADLLDYMDNTSVDETSKAVWCRELEAGIERTSLSAFAESLCHKGKLNRLSTLKILNHYELSRSCPTDNHGINIFELLLSIEETPLSVGTSRKSVLLISKLHMAISAATISEKYIPSVLYGLIGILHNRFRPLWNPVLECLSTLINQQFGMVWDKFVFCLERCQSDFVASHAQSNETEISSTSTSSDLVARFHDFVSPASNNTPSASVLSLLIQTLQKIPTLVESRTRQIVPLFLKFLGYDMSDVFSVGSFDPKACKGKEWRSVLEEWLNLFKLMRNPKSFYRDQHVKEVLELRLLDEYNEEIQTKVLDCLLNWKDEFLVPYSEHLKDLINSKSLRETLTTWSLSIQSTLIQENHRAYLVPLVIRLLVPKVRKLKTFASRKNTSVHHRKAVLGFFAQLEVNELPLFFSLLIKPLLGTSERSFGTSNLFWSSSEQVKDEFDSFSVLKNFTTDNTMALSWKKKYGFLHVVDDVLGVFDESHVKPYLDLLLGCVVRIMLSCTLTLENEKSSMLSKCEADASFISAEDENSGEAFSMAMTGTGMKQLRELRSFCLKIIAFVLHKYEDNKFGYEFWDLFFTSVKPLIDGFKKEGASSEKPSSLFSCFIAMSKSYKLVPLLNKETNLVPNIFSILAATTPSEAIWTSVLMFVENLLNLEIEFNQEDDFVKRLLLPNLDTLIGGLNHLFKFNNVARRKLIKCPGERELNIFKLLLKYIKHPSEASQFVDILLPVLAKGVQNSDACIEALQIIQHLIPVLGGESTPEILNAVSPLLISGGLDIRTSICDVLDALAGLDSSVMTVTKFLRELNATTSMDMGSLDYDRVISAYEQINKDFFYTVKQKHALLILSHAVHDMVSDEMILRQSGYGLLLSFIDFLAEILNQGLILEDLEWGNVTIEKIINKFLLKHMGDAMNNDSSVHKVWIDLLREMVLKIPNVNNLQSFRDLWSKDAEQDFFNNITHLQKHRRARAILQFKDFTSSGNPSEVITTKVFVPLFLKMLYDEQDGKAENIRRACLETLAGIIGNMEWKSYYAFLMKCFREMTRKPEKQKVLLRLISSILGCFHFLEPHSGTSSSLPVLHPCTSSGEATEIQACLQNNVLPKIQKLLASDSNKINVNISLLVLKLLKFLPGDCMDLQLPSIIHSISNFLKSRSDRNRDEARDALAACLKELGVGYLKFVVSVLQATLKRGFELHVLGYTLHFLLSKILSTPSCGNLDYCLQELLSIVENDIFGDVSEEKEVEKIASKMKETKTCKSFDTLELIAQSTTFKTLALKLLSPVATRLQKHLTPKEKSKIEKMLSNIAAGIQRNPSVVFTDLFIFLYGLIEDGISDENNITADEARKRIIKSGRLIDSTSQSSHLITVFALGMLRNCINNLKLPKKNEQLLVMVDPFVPLLSKCLNSKYEDVLSAALRCFTLVVKLPLPSLEPQADNIKTSLLDIAQGSVNASSPLVQSCLKLLTILLHNPRITLSKEQLQKVIEFPPFIDLEKNPCVVSLSLLKAIVMRKLVVPTIYDLVTRIADLMVTSQVEVIRKKCSQILLQFLLNYQLSKKRVQEHLDSLLRNLEYQHSTGRESVLEMLHAVAEKFPQADLDEHSRIMFLRLVLCLANDSDNRVRSMTGSALKHLIGRVSSRSLNAMVEDSLSWYFGKEQRVWSGAAQVLGLLVEAMQSGFQKYINQVLPVMRRIIHSAVDVVRNRNPDPSTEGAIPFWKEAYYSLVLLEKVLHQFPDLYLAKDLEDIWEMICELLLHPHMWLRDVTSRLLALYFASATKANNANVKKLPVLPLTKPSTLFLISVSLCCQVKKFLTDTTVSGVITRNLAFTILTLHSMLVETKGVDIKDFRMGLENEEKVGLLKALDLLGSGNGISMFASLISAEDNSMLKQSSFVSFLLKRMGKIAIQMEAVQMAIIFNVYKSVARKIIDLENISSDSMDGYAYEMLLPLYKVCEGYAGKVIPDEVKQLAQEALKTIRDVLGTNNFAQIYNQIRKNLKAKREKRKREEKVMAVVNPMRNAKRKLRLASKNKANKKRRVMTMKMMRWTR